MLLFGHIFFEKGDLGHVFFSKMTIICWHKSGQGQGCSYKENRVDSFPQYHPHFEFYRKKSTALECSWFFHLLQSIVPLKRVIFFFQNLKQETVKKISVYQWSKRTLLIYDWWSFLVLDNRWYYDTRYSFMDKRNSDQFLSASIYGRKKVATKSLESPKPFAPTL